MALGWMVRFALWIPITGLLLIGSAHADAADQHNLEVSANVVDFINFDALVRPSSPNTSLVGPADSSPPPDDEAPVLEAPASQLVEAWTQIIGQQPRSLVLGLSEDGLQVEAEQRSAIFRFVDRISFRAVELGPQRSTFHAYSRSLTGHSDFGVNRTRLSKWISALRDSVQGESKP